MARSGRERSVALAMALLAIAAMCYGAAIAPHHADLWSTVRVRPFHRSFTAVAPIHPIVRSVYQSAPSGANLLVRGLASDSAKAAPSAPAVEGPFPLAALLAVPLVAAAVMLNSLPNWLAPWAHPTVESGAILASSGLKTTKNKKVTITYDMKARQAMLRGINTVADTVGVTIGPRGRNVVMEMDGDVLVINDGVSIARSIELPDPMENAGAQLIKELASRTNDKAGDGTTTSSVLARDMIRRGLRAVATGRNPMSIKKGIAKAAAFVDQRLREQSIIVRGAKDIEFVATVAACNDAEIGRLIADAVDRVGADGVLSIEDSKSTDTWIDVRQGMEIDRGYISKEFINNNDRSTVDFENPAILITDWTIDNISMLVPLMEKVLDEAQRVGHDIPLVVIAEDVTPRALPLLIVNKLRGVLPCVAIRAPGFGDRRAPLLQDLAIYTNGEFVSKDLGMKMEDVELHMLGTCRKISVRETDLTIIADCGNKEDLECRIEQLKKDLAETDLVYDTLRIAERIAKLSGGIAIINVGANTEAELQDRRLRVEDAKNATFAALSDGILPGGGTALLHIAEELPSLVASIEDLDEQMGAEIVMHALPEPCRLIARNAGQEGEVIVSRLKGQPCNVGYNAMTDAVEDLVESGIIDPAKVTRNVVRNACSICEAVLTTQALVTGIQRPPPKEAHHSVMGE